VEGTVVGQYRVLKKLGEGGMGAVYVGEHSLIGRRAAIKVLLPQLSVNPEIVQRFFNEARAATAIADPGIVQIFDFGYHTDGSAYIVMEFLEGETLDGRLRRLGRLPAHDAARIMRQTASSLAAAHSRGIIHRDLKPENIFLVRDAEVVGGERAKILDFGIAKLTADDSSKVKTHTAAIMGTPWFMSPEQCRGAGQIDSRSDIYALGCVLFQLVTGTPPFDGEGAGEIIASHLRSPAPAPSSRVPGIPPEIDEVVLTCMAKSPDDRYQTMTALAAVLEQVVAYVTSPGGLAASSGGVGARAYPTAPPTPVGAPTTLSAIASQVGLSTPGDAPPKKRGLALAIGAITFAAVTAVVVVIATQGGGGTPAPATTTPAHQPAAPVPRPPVKEPEPTPPPPVEIKPPEPTPAPVETKAPEPTPAPVEVADPPNKKRRVKKDPKKCEVPGDRYPCDGIPEDR
jgi:serine/threonine-protein kinase